MNLRYYYEQLKGLVNTKGAPWNMIVIDGVVGVGKSTLTELLAKELDYIPYDEPVTGNPILDKFYYNRERYAFPLQVFFLNERFKSIKQASKQEKSVLDRSIYGDLIFAKMLNDNKEMSDEEYHIYIDLFHNMMEHCNPPKLMIYLEISPEKAIERIQRRGREYELVVEKQYWEALNRNYREYFDQYDFSPVLKINVDDLDFENNPADREHVLQRIQGELQSLGE